MNQSPQRTARTAGALSVALAGCLVVTGWIGVRSASAQAPQSLPGITIVGPSSAPMGAPPPGMLPGQPPPGAMMPPGPRLPQAPPQQAQPKPPAPKPKVKAAAVAKPKAEPANTDEAAPVKGANTGGIALLVNGDPITTYEIDQRARLMALSADIQPRAQQKMKELATSAPVVARWKQIVDDTVKANNGKSREQIMAILQEKQKTFAVGLQKQAIESARGAVLPGIRTKAREELIEEQIKLQEAREAKSPPDESMVNDLVKDIAQRNKMTPEQFTQHFAGLGVDISTLKAKFRAQLAWTSAVRRQFSHLTTPSNRDIDKLIQNDTGGQDDVELQLRRIVVPVPAKVDQKAMAHRLGEAEHMQQAFKRCATVGALAAQIQGSRYEDLGTRRVSTFTEPSRSMLMSAGEETMVPPTITSTGIELFAVCGRKVIKAVDLKRNEKQQEFVQERFELLSRARLRRLKDNAIIENR